MPHGAGLGAAERRRLQPHRRHRRPRRHRLRPGAGLAVARSRHRRDPARHPAAARTAAPFSPPPAPRRGCGRWWRSARAAVLADPSGAAERAFEAALRRAGVLCVTSLEDLLAAAEILARARPVRSEALSIVTNAISAGRMAADAVLRDGTAARRATSSTWSRTSLDASGRAGMRRCRGTRRRRRPGGACADRRGRSGGDRRARGVLATQSRCRCWSAPWARPPAPSAGAAWPRPAWRCSPRPSRRCAASCIWCRTAATAPPPANCRPARCWPWRRTATRCATCSPAIRRAGRLATMQDEALAVLSRLRHPGGAEPRRRLAGRCGRRQRRCSASPPW